MPGKQSMLREVGKDTEIVEDVSVSHCFAFLCNLRGNN